MCSKTEFLYDTVSLIQFFFYIFVLTADHFMGSKWPFSEKHSETCETLLPDNPPAPPSLPPPPPLPPSLPLPNSLPPPRLNRSGRKILYLRPKSLTKAFKNVICSSSNNYKDNMILKLFVIKIKFIRAKMHSWASFLLKVTSVKR